MTRLIETTCPNCSAKIKINSESDSQRCDYCGTTFIFEKPSKNFSESAFGFAKSVVDNYQERKKEQEAYERSSEYRAQENRQTMLAIGFLVFMVLAFVIFTMITK